MSLTTPSISKSHTRSVWSQPPLTTRFCDHPSAVTPATPSLSVCTGSTSFDEEGETVETSQTRMLPFQAPVTSSDDAGSNLQQSTWLSWPERVAKG